MIFLLLSASFLISFGERLDSPAALHPTHFTETWSLNGFYSEDLLSKGSGSHFLTYGSLGKTAGLSLRGGNANDSTIYLEDIRLNSPASGEFDLGMLSTFGLEKVEIIRGGGHLNSADSDGVIQFQIPREPKKMISFSNGSYGEFSLGLLSPQASISLEQGNFEYPYSYQGNTLDRANNFAQRLNARVWKKTDQISFLSQILFVDQGLPGPTYALSPHSNLMSLQPSASLSMKLLGSLLHLSAQMQRQLYSDPDSRFSSENRWTSLLVRDSMSHSFGESIQADGNFELGLDHLNSEQTFLGTESSLSSPHRLTASIAAGILWSPNAHWLVQPKIRIDYLNDLDREPAAIHPALGMKYRAFSDFYILANIRSLSRAPNFNEMYIDLPPDILGNRHLRRQLSYDGDTGFEWSPYWNLWSFRWSESVFAHRTERVLQDDPSTRAFQIENLGTAVTIGIESSLIVDWNDRVFSSLQYTWMNSSLGDDPKVYQPTHKLFFEPGYRPFSWFEIRSPLYFRSKVYAAFSQTLDRQFDLGIHGLIHWQKFTIELKGMNLAHWNREERSGYPLSNEAHYQSSLTYMF